MVWVLVIVCQIAGVLIGDALVSDDPKPAEQQYELRDFKITSECYRDAEQRLLCPRVKA